MGSSPIEALLIKHGPWIYASFVTSFSFKTLKLLVDQCKLHISNQMAQNALANTNPIPGSRERASIPPDWTSFYTQDSISATKVGFKNPRALCYRNASLVTLLHTPVFLNLLQYCCEHHKCAQRDQCPLYAFHNLSVSYWFGDHAKMEHETHLIPYWNLLHETVWQVNLTKQQDAIEFMEALIPQFRDHIIPNETPNFERMFYTTIKKFYMCTNSQCNHMEPLLSQETQLCLRSALPIANQTQPIAVEEVLAMCFQSSDVSGGTWKCSHCNHTKRFFCERIQDLPEILFVQTMRIPVGNQKSKNPVDFEEKLDIPDKIQTQELKKIGAHRYELYSVIFHFGKSESGHYTSAVKAPNGKWYKANDHIVEELTFSQLKTPQNQKDTCLLAYRRLPLDNNFPGKPSFIDTKPVNNDSSAAGSSNQAPKDSQSNEYITIEEFIEFNDRDLKWTKNDTLPLAKGAPLIKFKPGGRTQRVSIRLILTSKQTGDILEGEGSISLARGGKSTQAAKPQGVIKIASSPSGARRSQRLQNQKKKKKQ